MRALNVFKVSMILSVCMLALACNSGSKKGGSTGGTGGKNTGGTGGDVTSNTAPVLESAVIDPISYHTEATLIVVPGAATDAEEDKITFAYQWYVNGNAVADAVSDKLVGSQFSRDDIVYAEVTPSDGKLKGKAARSNSVTIANSVPGIAGASLYPAFATTDSLLWAGVTQQAVDADGDSLAYQYSWYQNGTLQGFANTQTTVAAALTVTGDTWRVDVRAKDGSELGAAVSRSVFIHRTLWAYSLGATNAEFARAATRTSGGDWVVAGDTTTFGAGTDAWITRIQPNGNVVWATRFGGSGIDKALAVAATSDDGILVAGDTESFGAVARDAFIAKFDAAGTLVWAKMIGGPSTEEVKSFIATGDGNFVMLIKTASFGAGAWVVKIDGTGAIVWQSLVSALTPSSLVGLSNGKFVVSGITGSSAAVALLSSTGTIAWKSVFGLLVGGVDSLMSRIVETSNGEIIGVGHTNAYTSGNFTYEGWFVRLNTDGSFEWQKRLMGANNKLFSIVDSPSGLGFIGELTVSGGSDTQLLIGRADELGRLNWSRSFGGTAMDKAAGLLPVANEGYFIWGSSLTVGAGGYDFLLANTSADGDTQFATNSLISATSHALILSDSTAAAPTITMPSASVPVALAVEITTATVAGTSWTRLKQAP